MPGVGSAAVRSSALTNEHGCAGSGFTSPRVGVAGDRRHPGGDLGSAGRTGGLGLARRASARGAPYAGLMEKDVGRVLADRETQLENELAELTKPPDELGTISFGKRIGEGTSMAVDQLAAVSTRANLLAVLDAVRRARRRLADGSYGACEVCGEPIPEGRLEARPWATRCVAHS